jgi:MFS family permease
VRLIGRNKFQDDPFFTQSTVAPGVMPIGTLGILLTITFFGAMISQLVLVPWADKFGRKVVFEISLLTTFVASILSVSVYSNSFLRVTLIDGRLFLVHYFFHGEW